MYDTAEEDIGGRNWGRICATAACLFIDGLNPPSTLHAWAKPNRTYPPTILRLALGTKLNIVGG